MRVQLRAGFLVLQASRLSGRPQRWLTRAGELSTLATEPILHTEGYLPLLGKKDLSFMLNGKLITQIARCGLTCGRHGA